MVRYTLILAVLLLLPFRGNAQTVTAFVQPDSLTTGSVFTYTITAQYPSARFTPIFPDSSAFGGDIEFRSMQRFRGVNSRDSVVYLLQFFALQDTLIGSKRITFSGEDGNVNVHTPPVAISFVSLVDDASSELLDLKPIFQFARSWLWLLILLAILTLLGALIYRNRHRFKKAEQPVFVEPTPVVPFKSPLVILQRELMDLQQTGLFAEDDFKEYYTRISNAFRSYFEEVYFIPALESTTREVVRDLKRKGTDERIIRLMESLLKESDLVKFAKYTATSDQAVKFYHHAIQLYEIVRTTDPERIEQLRYSYELKHGLRTEHGSAKVKPTINPLVQHNKEIS